VVGRRGSLGGVLVALAVLAGCSAGPAAGDAVPPPTWSDVPSARVSPVQLPAFSIAHGTADCLVPLGQATLLADALRAAGNRPDVHVLDDAAHADRRFDGELLAPTIAWLDRVLRVGATPAR